ncbi:MAG TPA: PorV/PorQ family protein [Ignavibacteria bacterium]|nr:PorV/PorQ family protein [Ignavibacteria bacterium]
MIFKLRKYKIGKGALAAIIVLLSVNCLRAQLIPNLGGQRTGTSSFQFLKIGTDARGTGMGETVVAVSDDISALSYNPAGIVLFNENGVTFTHTQWFVDTRLESAAGVFHFGSNALGLSVTSLRTEDMKVTTEFQHEGTGDYFRFSDLAIGLTFARKMTDQFSFGATVRYVEEELGALKMRTVVGDLATYYRTGLGTSRFAVMITNFGGQVSPTGSVNLVSGRTVDEFQSFPPPTVFRVGFAFEPWMNERNRLTTSIQLNSPNDNKENFSIGAEYAYKNFLFVRGGYKFNVDAENFSGGIGLKFPVSFAKGSLDYSVANFGELGFAHRFTLSILFPKKHN